MAAYNVFKAGGALLSSLGGEISNLSGGGPANNDSSDEDEKPDNSDPTFVQHGRRGILVYNVIAIERTGNAPKTVHVDIESRAVNVYDVKFSRSYKCSTIFGISLLGSTVIFKTNSSRSLHPKNYKFANDTSARSFVDVILFLIEYGSVIRSAYSAMVSTRGFLTLGSLQYGLASQDLNISSSDLQKILDLRDGECFDFIDFFNQMKGSHIGGLRDCLYVLIVNAGIHDNSPLLPNGRLLPGESLVTQMNSVLCKILASEDGEGLMRAGTFTITNYRLVFSCLRYPADPLSRYHVPPFFDLLSIPLNAILRVKVSPVPSSLSHRPALTIKTKDSRFFRISLINRLNSFEELVTLKSTIESHCFPMRLEKLFCFKYCPQDLDFSDAWVISNIHVDYQRMGILDDSEWRIVPNGGGSMVTSYPECFAVPSNFPPDDISSCWAYRSKGRLPVLTYRHRNTQACLTRSSQPMLGSSKDHLKQDVNLLNAYRTSGVLNEVREVESQRSAMFYIVDARGMLAAVANMAVGRGTEEVSSYTRTELIYAGIDNIHTMRTSHQALCAAAYNDRGGADGASAQDESFTRKVDTSGWLLHCSRVLSASVTVAEKLHLEGCSVLVHCSDGWDRTAQLSATAQILLDPYYRTIDGFAVLVEKDWCAFGHKFDHRLGNAVPATVEPDERSPVFLQWLDVVFQIYRQFRNAFEFNEYFLVFVADHVNSGLFGNFIGNTENERMHDLSVSSKTVSIWAYINTNLSQFASKQYREIDRPIWPSCSLRSMVLWERFYLRWDPLCHPRGGDPDDDWHDDWGAGFETT